MKLSHFVLSAAILAACSGSDTPTNEAATPPSQAAAAPQTVSQATAPQPVDVAEDQEETTEVDPANIYALLADPDGLTELNWDDLMPIGEDEVLAELYETYYANLRTDLADRSERLLDSGNTGGSEFDVSALISEGATNDTMEQIGTFNVVEQLNGLNVRLPGYVVPLDFSADGVYSEFLLVPYFGACLHTPPPPPNQIVFVKAEPATKVASIYEPVWVEGILKTGQFESDTGDSAYELTLSTLEVYEY